MHAMFVFYKDFYKQWLRRMEIPKFLKDKINEDTKLSGIVNTAISKTHNIINKAQPDFFPEYTDHGPDHNTDVLASAADLMTEEARKIFSPSDAAALTLAVLLHDCGMHLTPDGFKTLIASDYRGVDGLDNTTWLELWNDYMMQARRYDERTLIDIFGDAHPIGDDPVDKQPIDLTVRDKMLIGDFLRRHHSRLAHEIALNGFPGVKGNIGLFDVKCDVEMCSAWGMIARSHGMALRQANDEFARIFDRYEFRNIHGCYLMVLLRIADLMQIQAERAPEGVFQIKKLKSPFSQGEWKVHQSVSNITRAGSDPEAISIKAEPESVEIFLKVKGWTDYLQTELDQSWAVLGEEYGRQDDPPLKNLQLKLRRVKTNFDDNKKFGENVDYVPRKIAFDTNNPDLLNLLVGPLYDERPEIGIRELMQNAVDAVRERTEIEGTPPTELINGKDDDVSISIDGDEERGLTVTISDRGIGMNLDFIENYFLKAGSSFRNSAIWKKHFQDDDGNSKITRSGRFGIGALAVFLIGSTARIRTRHYKEDKGFEFTAELGKSAITITPYDCDIGTEIVVEVDDDKIDKVLKLTNHKNRQSWDFYIYGYPLVTRYIHKKQINQSFTFDPDQLPNNHFVRLTDTYYKNIFWRFARLGTSIVPSLFCNGIEITQDFGKNFWPTSIQIPIDYRDNRPFPQSIWFSRNLCARTPNLLIEDTDGILPINIRRDGLTHSDVALAKKLISSIADDLIAGVVAFAPEHHIKDCMNSLHKFKLPIGYEFRRRLITAETNYFSDSYWVWLDGGWSPGKLLIKKADASHEFLLLGRKLAINKKIENFEEAFNKCLITKCHASTKGSSSNTVALNFLKSLTGNNTVFPELKNSSFKLCVNRRIVKYAEYAQFPNYLQRLLTDCRQFETQHTLTFTTPKFSHRLDKSLEKIDQIPHEFTDALYLIHNNPLTQTKFDSDLFDRWKELCGDQLIPWRWEDRVKAFPKAFEVLGDRIEYHRAQKLKAEKEDLKS